MNTSPADQPQPDPVPEPSVKVESPRHRISSVWIIPIVAAGLGLWLVYQNYVTGGPTVNVRFETGLGIDAEKTKVQCRNVTVGHVAGMRLMDDLTGVIVKLELNSSAKRLLRSDTRFWVVRARVGGGGISGLGTLVSGAYIELDPGVGERKLPETYTGLETPPATPSSVPGLRLKLTADEAGSLGPGSTILFRGITVGNIESRRFDTETVQVVFDAFVEAKYARLVSGNTHFWNVSGLNIQVGANGFSLETGSVESILLGGIEFDVPDGTERGPPVADGSTFTLYKSRRAVEDLPKFNARLTYMLLVKDSVRGLNKDAPVTFRGIRVGTVQDVSFKYHPNDEQHRAPVIIVIDPSSIVRLPDDTEASARAAIADAVMGGLRASLTTGSLLTGQLFVDLDYPQKPQPGAVVRVGKYEVLPTTSGGLKRIEDQINEVLAKIKSLKIEETLASATKALDEIKGTAAGATEAVVQIKAAAENLDRILADEKTRALPADLQKSLASIQSTIKSYNSQSAIYSDVANTLADLRAALKSVEALAKTVDRKPNSLIFGRSGGNPDPPKGRRP